jgi:hypothetical protein
MRSFSEDLAGSAAKKPHFECNLLSEPAAQASVESRIFLCRSQGHLDVAAAVLKRNGAGIAAGPAFL